MLLGAQPATMTLTLVDAEQLDRAQIEEVLRLVADAVGRVSAESVGIAPVPDHVPVVDALPGLWLRAYRGVVQVRLTLERHEAGAPIVIQSVDAPWPLVPGSEALLRLARGALGHPEPLVASVPPPFLAPAPAAGRPAQETTAGVAPSSAPPTGPIAAVAAAVTLGLSAGVLAALRAGAVPGAESVTVVSPATARRHEALGIGAWICASTAVAALGVGIVWAWVLDVSSGSRTPLE